MSVTKAAEKLAAKAAQAEVKLTEMDKNFALQNKEFAAYLKKQQEEQKKITQLWNDVKKALIEAEYFDVLENELFRVSVSKVSGITVKDLNEVPEQYTEVVKVAKMDEIKKHYELYGELPAGTVDSSYYRLNKKVK